MSDLATATASFLDKVEGYAPGQASRFAPPLEELIRWSEANGLEFSRHNGTNVLLKFTLPGSKSAFWSATPRTGDGAKLTILTDPRFPEPLRAVAREELAQIDRKVAQPDSAPEVAFTKLIWEPYRTRVLDLMARLLDGVKQPVPASSASPEA